MPIYKGSTKIGQIFIGSSEINSLYKGSVNYFSKAQPTPPGPTPGTVIFESSTPGTYQVTIPASGNYAITLVGGGAGGYAYTTVQNKGGCNGSMITGTTYLEAGTYSLAIGSGAAGAQFGDSGVYDLSDGGNTTFLDNIAKGGLGHSRTNLYANNNSWTYYSVPTVVSSGLTGTNGNATNIGTTNGAPSLLDGTMAGPGAGGYIYDSGDIWWYTNGINGYAKIMAA